MAPFFASLVYVGLKATQQLNVVYHIVWAIIPVSYGMALCEFFLVGYIAMATVEAVSLGEQAWLIFQIGTGAGTGAVFSMILHKRIRKENEKQHTKN